MVSTSERRPAAPRSPRPYPGCQAGDDQPVTDEWTGHRVQDKPERHPLASGQVRNPLPREPQHLGEERLVGHGAPSAIAWISTMPAHRQ